MQEINVVNNIRFCPLDYPQQKMLLRRPVCPVWTCAHGQRLSLGNESRTIFGIPLFPREKQRRSFRYLDLVLVFNARGSNIVMCPLYIPSRIPRRTCPEEPSTHPRATDDHGLAKTAKHGTGKEEGCGIPASNSWAFERVKARPALSESETIIDLFYPVSSEGPSSHFSVSESDSEKPVFSGPCKSSLAVILTTGFER